MDYSCWLIGDQSSVPACTVFFQKFFLRDKIPPNIYMSLIPIVGGVMLATETEVNYHAVGFWTAVVASFITGKVVSLLSSLAEHL